MLRFSAHLEKTEKNAMQTNVSLVMQEAAKAIFHTIVFNRTVGVHQPQ